MCLAIPGKVTDIENGEAVIDYGGVTKRASTRLMESAKPGDYVLVHAGFIIQIVDEDAGKELEELIRETIGFE